MSKRRKKYKVKPITYLLFILIIGGIIFLFKDNIFNKNKPSAEANSLLKEHNISSDKYSEALEYALKNDIYDEKYLDQYKDIEVVDSNLFKDVLTTYLSIGYSGKEINYIMALSEKNIESLKAFSFKVNLENYYKIKNFDVNKYTRYEDYKEKNKKLDYSDIVTRVNIKLDLPVYTDTIEASDPNSLLVIVNKYNHLPKNYTPEDLVYLDGAYGNKVPMREVIKDSFLELQSAAKNEINITLMPTTAFRDESFQTTLYNNYVASDGKEKADTYSARPGYSEHQTGLAIDLKNTSLNSDKRLTDENYKWLEDNSYKYGFVIRFPKGKENITGYQFENWHIRYVGKDIAKIIHDNDLTLEEYLDLYETDY